MLSFNEEKIHILDQACFNQLPSQHTLCCWRHQKILQAFKFREFNCDILKGWESYILNSPESLQDVVQSVGLMAALQFWTLTCVFAGDLPYEAHVQTHSGGAPSEPSVASEDRVPQHPHPHLPHLSSPAARQQVGFKVYLRLELMRPCTHSHLHKAYISIMTADMSIQLTGCLHPSRHRPSVKNEHSVIMWM